MLKQTKQTKKIQVASSAGSYVIRDESSLEFNWCKLIIFGASSFSFSPTLCPQSWEKLIMLKLFTILDPSLLPARTCAHTHTHTHTDTLWAHQIQDNAMRLADLLALTLFSEWKQFCVPSQALPNLKSKHTRLSVPTLHSHFADAFFSPPHLIWEEMSLPSYQSPHPCPPSPKRKSLSRALLDVIFGCNLTSAVDGRHRFFVPTCIELDLRAPLHLHVFI